MITLLKYINTRKAFLFFFMAGFLAFGLRIAFLIISSREVLPTGDEGLLMLQAKAIWQGREWPLLFWAQPYTFPIESYLNAPFSAILPSNAFGARVVSWFWGLSASVLALMILRRMGPLRDVWPGYLLVLFPSAYLLTMQAGYAPPSYPSLMGLFFLAILFAKNSESAQQKSKKFSWVILSGLFAGLVFSVTLLAMPLLVGLALFYSMRGRFKASLQQFTLFCFAAAIGLIPHILARLTIPGAYSAVSQHRSIPGMLNSIWEIAIQATLPRTFGIHTPVFPDLTRKTLTSVKEFADVFYIVWLIIFIAVILLGAYRLLQSTKESGWLKLDFVHIFSVVTMLAIMLFGLSERAHSNSYRYLLLVVLCFPFQIAYLYQHMNRPLRGVLGGFIVLLSLVNIIHSVKLMRFWKEPGFGRAYAEVRPLGPLIETLDREQIRYAYGSWFSAHRLTYATDERIISGQYYNERFLHWPTPYKAQIDAQQKVAFILDWSRDLDPQNFVSEMQRAYPEVSYEESKADYYAVYHHFQNTPQSMGIDLSATLIAVESSHNPETAPALIDQDFTSRWRSIVKQNSAMYLELILSEQQAISQLKLYYSRHTSRQAKKLRVLAWQHGEWISVKENIEKNSSFIDFQNSHPVITDQYQSISFPTISTDRLRIEITEPDEKQEWSIWEIKLFGPAEK